MTTATTTSPTFASATRTVGRPFGGGLSGLPDAIVKAAREGKTATEMAKMFGVTSPAIIYHAKAMGIVLPKGRRGRPTLTMTNPELVNTMRRLRFNNSDLTDAEIATACGVSVPTVRKYVDNIPTPRRTCMRVVNMRTGETAMVAAKASSVVVDDKENQLTMTVKPVQPSFAYAL